MTGLTDKKERFCQEYIIDLNGKRAAERAEYSPKTAQEQSSRLLSNVKVQERIAELKKERSERTQITQDMVVKELAKLGFSNMCDYATWNNSSVTLKNSGELTKDQSAVVSEVSQTETKDGGSIKFKLHDKKGSLELLGKHLGIFKEVVDVNLGNCGAVRDIENGEEDNLVHLPKKKAVGSTIGHGLDEKEDNVE